MGTWWVLALTMAKAAAAAAAAVEQQPNVLFIAVDDMRPLFGFEDETIQTPHLDGLAQDALVLRSHVQYALCAPSRASVMFGRRPDTLRVWELEDNPRAWCEDCLTIPLHFKDAGYFTKGVGKLFHPVKELQNDPRSWSTPYFEGPDPYLNSPSSWLEVDESQTGECRDTVVRGHVTDWLSAEAALNEPFFLGVGFRKPHLSFAVPKQFYEPYDDVELAPNPFAPVGMPPVAYASYEVENFDDIKALGYTGEINQTLPDWKARELVRAYRAGVTYADHNIGVVLAATRDHVFWDHTIVCVWSDHGWKLGHHGGWAKHTVFAEDTTAPIFLRVPGVTDGRGRLSPALVEHVDIMPTLVEAALHNNLPLCLEEEDHDACTEGVSFYQVAATPDRDTHKTAVFAQYMRWGGPTGKIMGYEMTTNDLRFTAWVPFDYAAAQPIWDLGLCNVWYPVRCAFELYDHAVDPLENRNIADGAMDLISSVLMPQLRAGWRAAVPAIP
ncbi:hypothetical protein CTAYLR_004665 [Chrysophaeum taylorii]|uniref:Sulfatase N-terminal domain-containing protein n=1 Tax=Chrysophaeum taylorii TaxID=2483200 RepID=A0AAD7U8Z0_9STRA|nr:hypothetical protein CTAYLR_004665 [Chrysophaeum taylorii]